MQQFVAVLKKKMKNQRTQKFATFSSNISDLLLREVGTEYVCEILKASLAVQTYAAVAAQGTQCFLALFREKNFYALFEWRHVSAERSSQEEGSREDQPSAVRSDSKGSVASFSRYWVPEQVPTGYSSSCKTTSRNGKADRGGCSAAAMSSKRFVEVHTPEKLPNCLLSLPHVRQ